MVLLDLSAAFDTVNHSRFLSRLQITFGIQGTVMEWFRSYLSSRTQFVSINSNKIYTTRTYGWNSTRICDGTSIILTLHRTTC